MQPIIVLTAFLFLTPAGAAPKASVMDCSVKYDPRKNQDVDRKCRDLSDRGPLTAAAYPDGTRLPNLFAKQAASGPLSSTGLSPAANQTRIEKVFGDLKRTMEAMVLNGRSLSEANEQQQYLVRKLNDMKLVWDDHNVSGSCLDHRWSNVTYAPNTNTVRLCPVQREVPPESLIAILSHEVGHGVHHCTFTTSFPFSAGFINQAREKRLGAFAECLAKGDNQEQGEWQKLLTDMISIYPTGLTFLNIPENSMAELHRCKVITGERKGPPASLAGHPFLQEANCAARRFPNPSLRVSDQPLASNTQNPSEAEEFDGSSLYPQDCARTAVESFADHVGGLLAERFKNDFPGHFRAGYESALQTWLEQFSCLETSNDGIPDKPYPVWQERLAAQLRGSAVQQLFACDGGGLRLPCPLNVPMPGPDRALQTPRRTAP